MPAPSRYSTASWRASCLRDHRQQQVRGMRGVVIDPMQHGLAAADMVWDVLDVGGAADAGGDIETRDLDTDAVPALELDRGRHDLDGVFVDLAGRTGPQHRPGRMGGARPGPARDPAGPCCESSRRVGPGAFPPYPDGKRRPRS